MEQQQNWGAGLHNFRQVTPQAEELPFQAREAINVLRGNIQLSGYDLKVIAITSAQPNEGKSSVAFRLSRSLAALGKKTIYVDCDIRNSEVMARYEIQQSVCGLSEFLCGRVTINDIIYCTDNQFMDMIFTGAVAPNPSELVSGPLFVQLLDDLKKNYDYVIVDTPPVNPVIDGALIAKKCDGTVLVVECGFTERAQAVKAKRQLEYAGIKILGVVLNKVGLSKKGYGYGYGYGEKNTKATKKKAAKAAKAAKKEKPARDKKRTRA